jgi:hypothetical protein
MQRSHILPEHEQADAEQAVDQPSTLAEGGHAVHFSPNQRTS